MHPSKANPPLALLSITKCHCCLTLKRTSLLADMFIFFLAALHQQQAIPAFIHLLMNYTLMTQQQLPALCCWAGLSLSCITSRSKAQLSPLGRAGKEEEMSVLGWETRLGLLSLSCSPLVPSGNSSSTCIRTSPDSRQHQELPQHLLLFV